MQTLSVLGVERGAVVVIAPDGQRYRLPVDAALLARLQAAVGPADEKRMTPREIQAYVRAGMTAEQVAALAGVSVAAVERFVGPVLAERAYVVESALAVRLPPETEGARSRTFGAVMGDRLAALAASQIRWSGAKEPSGWVLSASFVADDVQHDARWRFDPKRMQLDPDNVEASTLSQRGTPAALTPRLRAIEPTAPVTIVPAAGPTAVPARVPAEQADVTRFDSAVFRLPDLTAEAGGRRPAGMRDEQRTGPTTDQLASLSRRRGQREPVETASLPVTRAIDVIDDAEGVDDVFAPRPVPERARPGAVTQGRFGARATASGPADTAAAEQPHLPSRPRAVPADAPAAPSGSVSSLPTRSAAAPSTSGSPASGSRPVAPAPGSAPSVPSTPATAGPAAAAPGSDGAGRRPQPAAQPAPHGSHPSGASGAPTAADTGELRRPRARRAERRSGDQSTTETLPPLDDTAAQTRGGQSVRPRRGRTSMPSWDEIVFGRDEH